MRPDELSSVLRQSRLDASDFKIYVDIPQENKSGDLNRGISPSTPKRSRMELPLQDSSFGDLSPIPSGVVTVVDSVDTCSLQTTPKRRRSLRSTAPTSSRSLTDLFSAVREEALNHMDEDVSRSHSGRRQSVVSRSADFTGRFYTPPRTRSQTADQRRQLPPLAPRKKPPRDERSLSPLPSPKRLDFSNMDITRSPPTSFPIDYGAVMGIVGFVSSYLVRTNASRIGVNEIAEFISTVSMTHRSKSSAIEIVRSLVSAVPNWVMYSDNSKEILDFNRSVKTFDVLSTLRAMKRRILLNLDE